MFKIASKRAHELNFLILEKERKVEGAKYQLFKGAKIKSSETNGVRGGGGNKGIEN